MNKAEPIKLEGIRLELAVDALQRARGVIVQAAKYAGVTRACFYLWLQGTPELYDALMSEREKLAAVAERKLVQIMLDDSHRGQLEAVKYVLDNHGTPLGYGKPNELLLTVQQEPHAAALAILGVTKQAHPDIVIDSEEPKA